MDLAEHIAFGAYINLACLVSSLAHKADNQWWLEITPGADIAS